MSQYEPDQSRGLSRSHKRRRDYDDVPNTSEAADRSQRRLYCDKDDENERPRKRRSLTPSHDEDRDSRREDRKQRRALRSNHRHISRSRSPERLHRHKHRPRSRSRHEPRSRSASPKAFQRSKGPLPTQNKAFEQEQGSDSVGPAIEKQKPNFAPSGRLAAASNTVKTAGQTIVLKYHEPSEARKPPAKDAWRMYVFKNDEIVDTVPLHEQSCWLFGRELAVCDIPVEHPSASKQHAVVQFRFVEKRNEFGDKIGKVKPYLIDLESGNGTFVNDAQVAEGRYMELRDGDVIKFGQSKREYVVQLPKA